MKRFVIVFPFLLLVCLFTAQSKPKILPQISTWHISDKTAALISSTIDTAVYSFPLSNQIDKYSIANAYNGVLGSPLQSKIYSDRTQKTDFLFSTPYDAYFLAPSDIVFYNTTTPYSNLTYFSSGGSLNKEDDFSALFTVNPSKRSNITGVIDYVQARGVYSQQATQLFKGGLNGSYLGRWYSASGIVLYQGFNNQENGGISHPDYITRPDSLSGYAPENIPVLLGDAKSKYSNKYLYFTQKVSFGKGRNATNSITKDSIRMLSLGHTIKIEQAQKRYKANNDAAYYSNTYFDSIATMDSTRYRSYRNTLALTVNEGFSRWFPLGLTAYIEDDYQEYFLLTDSLATTGYENDILIGVEMAKRKGSSFLFAVTGELNTIGRKAGDFNLQGNMSSSFRLFKDTVLFMAKGYVKNTSPLYFENNYTSNHFSWQNNFDKSFKTFVNGSIGLKNSWLNMNLGLGLYSLSNLIYYNVESLPTQHSGTIQLLEGCLHVNLTVGVLHLHNKVSYQQSSNKLILPLPEIASYSNLFVSFKLFKEVLTTQLGADLYYHTAYYAPSYMPATGVFYQQQNQQIGNYPLLSVYANFHLKTATFFIKYANVSALFLNPTYFSMPNYPLYPQLIRTGISWNFFD